MLRPVGRAALLLLVVVATQPAAAATLVLPATQDTWIRQDAPTANAGSDLCLRSTLVPPGP